MDSLINKKYWIWFSLIKNLGNARGRILLEKFKNPERIYNAKKSDLENIKGIGEKLIENIIDIETKENVDKNIKLLQKNNVNIVTIEDKEYPTRLKNIYDYPLYLYIKGNEKILNENCISIVGCRDYSEYGRKSAKYFSYNLAKEGIVIVSGLAKGIDSFAHKAAIEAKGKTIAVVGNGLDIVYPSENTILASQILETGGAIISEYPIGTKPEKINFPARNRIITGISDRLLVVEAKKQSGTLITVDFALEQGKDVYAVPGNINLINSVGTNELIKQGATLVTNYKEIII